MKRCGGGFGFGWRQARLGAPITMVILCSAPLAHAATIACEAMAGRGGPASSIALPTKGYQITSARSVAAVAELPANGRPGGQSLTHPSHCRLEGSILPVDPKAPPINFAIAIPQTWNGGIWQVGGGGMNGSIPDLTTSGGASPAPAGAPSLLTLGFAVYGSDSGHQGQAPEWARNEEAWLNLAYNQLKKTHDAATAVIETMQGRKPQRSYFSGGSQGGREALQVVARYGDDYDGVISTVPLAYMQGLYIHPIIRAINQTKPGAWIPPSKRPLLNAAVKKTCDGLDGLEDGVIGDYVGCANRLDASVTPDALSFLRCASGGDEGDSCLSTAQLAMFNALHRPTKYPYTLPSGFSDWPGWGGGAETALLLPAKPDPDDANAGDAMRAATQRSVLGLPETYNLYKFDLSADRAAIQKLSRDVDVAADFSTFIRNGGKLIIVSGASDTVSNPRAQMRLYDEVVKRNGKAMIDGAVRYYVIPSGDHGRNSRSLDGQPMPSAWNLAGALRDWVEQGVMPPDAPVLATYSGDTITATRLMCRYPAYPHYVAGSPNWATAYSCRQPTQKN